MAAAGSELENQTISMDDAQSTVSWGVDFSGNLYCLLARMFTLQLHSEQVRKQFEIDNLQHTLDIEKGALDQMKKVQVACSQNIF